MSCVNWASGLESAKEFDWPFTCRNLIDVWFRSNIRLSSIKHLYLIDVVWSKTTWIKHQLITRERSIKHVQRKRTREVKSIKLFFKFRPLAQSTHKTGYPEPKYHTCTYIYAKILVVNTSTLIFMRCVKRCEFIFLSMCPSSRTRQSRESFRKNFLSSSCPIHTLYLYVWTSGQLIANVLSRYPRCEDGVKVIWIRENLMSRVSSVLLWTCIVDAGMIVWLIRAPSWLLDLV